MRFGALDVSVAGIMGARSVFSLKTAVADGLGFVPKGIGAAWLVLAGMWIVAVCLGQTAPFTALNPAVRAGLGLLLLLLALMAEGALYRAALFGAYARAEGLGFGGLQLAKPEGRLILAGILVLLFMSFIGLFLSLLLALGLNMAGLVTSDMNLPHDLLRYHGKATLGVVAAMVFILIFLIYLGFRLCLYKAATIATHQVVSLNALSLSEGLAFKLFVGAFILCLPVIAVVAVFMRPDALLAHINNMAHWQSPLSQTLIAQAALKALAIFIVTPALAGFLSSAYRQTVELRAKE